MTRIRFVLPIAALLAAVSGPTASAGPLFEALKTRQARLDKILAKTETALTKAQKAEIDQALAELFDFKEMGRISYGDPWDQLSPSERAEFLTVFEALVRASSLRKVEMYRADSIDYVEETATATTGTARTRVQSKEAATEVVYEFQRQGEEWRVVDYTIDGVSAMRNYRSQFGKLLAKKGFSGLLERLRKRTLEIESGSRAATVDGHP